MTCQECELKLGMGENADEHLAACDGCRGLAEDLRLNAEAFAELRNDPLPRRRMRWQWALAAAAMLVLALGLARSWRGPEPLLPPVRVAVTPPKIDIPHVRPTPVKHAKARRGHEQSGPTLTVKMLTPDPNVVIYWLVDTKEGIEE